MALPMPFPPPVMTTFSCVLGDLQNLRMPARLRAAYSPPTIAPIIAGIQHGALSMPAGTARSEADWDTAGAQWQAVCW